MTRPPETPAHPLEGLAPTGAPPWLKARVLAASRAALLAPPGRPDPWGLLWASRPFRLAWAASVLLLLAGHVVLVRPPQPQRAPAPSSAPQDIRDANSELRAVARLPRVDPDALSLGAGLGDLSTPSRPSAPEPPKENRT